MPGLLLLLLVGLALPVAAAPDPPPVKIAFLGDQGLGTDPRAVLQMIEDEGANAVLHPGDLDYASNPAGFFGQVDSVLGASFPYFITCGNHDESQWYAANGYQDRFEARLTAQGIAWSGDLGIQSTIVWQGLRFVMTAPGSFGSGHDAYIKNTFTSDKTSLWRISTWHKNQNLMQVGGKGNEAGWGVYEESRKAGAIIITAHEHSYCRSHLLSDCDNPTIANTSNTLELEADDPATTADEGRTFVVVSGLAGESIRNQERNDPWWASIYTSDQGADYGAMFCTFGDNGPRHASCYFKAINGDEPDAFFVRTPHGNSTGEPPTGTAACGDGIDNDGNGEIDFPADRGCQAADDTVERRTRFACEDGVDNDGDGKADFPADPGCPIAKATPENPICDDGQDNDGNGLADFQDPGCRRDFPYMEGGRCGKGTGLALVLPPLVFAGRYRSRRRA